MHFSPPASRDERPTRRWQARFGTALFVAGLLAAIFAVRSLPPAPLYSPRLGRATYWQSNESAYFASLRAYEQPIRELLADGYLPIVVFGDSTIRGVGATGEDVWTRQLEKRLQAANPRVRVLNYAQNAGDLMGPFLYHHLQKKFPQAHYIVQWFFPSAVGPRHRFHYWLTSEIVLRDGRENPAVAHSLNTVPVATQEERLAFALAALNVTTNYLDAGNWVRYLWLGWPFRDHGHRVKIAALRDAAESDVGFARFVAPTAEQAATVRGHFLVYQNARANYLNLTASSQEAYFAEMFPGEQRRRLLLLTLDFNPYFAPQTDNVARETWRTQWTRLRANMARMSDLTWVSLTGSAHELEVDDYFDMGHLTIGGQHKLAEKVADRLLAPDGWFPAAPGPTPKP